MNVISFNVEVAFKNMPRRRMVRALSRVCNSLLTSVKEQLVRCYKSSTDDPNAYNGSIKVKWQGVVSTINSLYSVESLVAAAKPEGVDYYLFDTDNSGVPNNKRITLDVLILAKNDDINASVSIVMRDISRTLSECGVKTLDHAYVYVYPYDRNKEDICDAAYKIRANFQRIQFSTPEKWRFFGMTALTITLALLHQFGTFSDAWKNVFVGVYCSSVVFLMSEFGFKYIVPKWFGGRKYSVAINNLSNFIDQPPVPYEDEGDDLETPDL